MEVNLHRQFARIQNPPGGTLVDMSVRVFPEKFN